MAPRAPPPLPSPLAPSTSTSLSASTPASACPSPCPLPPSPPVPTVPLTVTSAADAAAVYAALFPVNDDDSAAAGVPPPPLVVTPVIGGITNHIWRVERAGSGGFSDHSGGRDSGDGDRSNSGGGCDGSSSNGGGDGGGGSGKGGRSSSPTVLVRAFGPVPGLDRAAENRVVEALAAAGVAPPLYAFTANGRVEGWHAGTRPANVDDLSHPGVYVPLARELAALHAIDTAVGGGGQGGGGEAHSGGTDVGDGLWRRISGWTADARGMPAVAATAGNRLDAIDTAASRVRAVLAHRYPPPPRVLCHNDLLAANVLLSWGGEVGEGGGREGTPITPSSPSVVGGGHLQQPPPTMATAAAAAGAAPATTAGGLAITAAAATGEARVFLIDFEYAAVGPRGFDVGNHWAEWRGGTDDGVPVLERYPSAAVQRAFCRAYLSAAAAATAASGRVDRGGHGVGGARDVTDEDVDALVAEATRWAGVSHLYWAAWAYAQAGTSAVPFDYLGYARRRWEAFEAEAADRGLV